MTKHPTSKDTRRALRRKFDKLAKRMHNARLTESREMGAWWNSKVELEDEPNWFRFRYQRALCSCPMCGNPRNKFRHSKLKFVTSQERRSMDSMRDQLGELL
jgi:hypothetical protein